MEKLTGHKAHPWLRRGLFFSHRDFEMILDLYEKKEPFYLYTGRGPSSDSLHLGMSLPLCCLISLSCASLLSFPLFAPLRLG